MSADAIKSNYVEKYNAVGERQFYKFLLSYAVERMVKAKNGEKGSVSPEVEFLERAEKFLHFYRQDNQDIYLNISRIFRKAAHKIYRLCLKNGTIKRNNKFLNLVG
jgi:hypothetical protein